jgi:integrase
LQHFLRDRWNDSTHRGADDFVFCDSAGSPHCADVLRRDVLYPTLDRIGIPRSKRNAGFHTFRHSVASFINRETGNLKLAQKLLGHANINITSDVYTHTSAKEDREAALAVERVI